MAAEEQCTIVQPHTYLSSTKHEYRTCFLCKARKSMVCVKCGSCLLCHPSTERIETRKPGFYTGIAMLLDIECPALAEIKRWTRYLLYLNHSRVKAGFQHWDQKDMHVIFMSLLIGIVLYALRIMYQGSNTRRYNYTASSFEENQIKVIIPYKTKH
jgi:hypothetical protein